MVINPRFSQKVMSWCVESVLDLIFNAIETANRRWSSKDISSYLEQQQFDLEISSRKISRMVYELKRNRYIDISEGDSVVLTNKAKIRIIDQITNRVKNDNKTRIVSFDIPEVKRAERNQFRRAIKRMGFRQIQKSLWVNNKNVGYLVEMAALEYKVADYVAYFVADKSNIDRHIAKVISQKTVK